MHKIATKNNIQGSWFRDKEMGLVNVNQLWDRGVEARDYHEWHPPGWWEERFIAHEVPGIMDHLQEICLKVQIGLYKLKWGY